MGLRRRRRRVPLGLLLIIGFLVVFLIVEIALSPTVIALAEAQAEWEATEAIHQAVLDVVDGEVSYGNLVNVQRDKDGRIVYMQANIVGINRMASNTAMEVQERLKQLRYASLGIPLGQILGSKLLATYGPQIGVDVVPVGTVKVKVVDGFDQAGINQTRHWISLEVESQLRVIIPLLSSDILVAARVPVADSIIVGPVPDAYLSMNLNEPAVGLDKAK